jgi:large repetitive protein
MKSLLLILCLPVLALTQPQPLQFQFQPAAFPASINGLPINQPWCGGIEYLTPTFCDLDHDDDLDLFCGDSRSWINHFENIGNANSPNFQFITAFFDSLSSYRYMNWCYSSIDFADLNGDSLQDALMAGVAYNYLLLYHNRGTASQPLYYPPADTLRDINNIIISDADRAALVDIDADGKMDLVVGRYAGYLKYYHNVGTTTSPVFTLVNNTWFNIYSSEGNLDPCFGDLDGDGDLDLLIGTGAGHVIYYRNDGTPQVPQMTLVPNYFMNINLMGYASPELADIDGDGDLDLFVGQGSLGGPNPVQGNLFFYLNDGTSLVPYFRFVISNYLVWDCVDVATPRLVDVNGDGLADLLSRFGNHLIYYRNAGTLGNPNFIYESSNYGNLNVNTMMPWFVDINGDGLLDLIAGTGAIPGPPQLKLFFNQGTPQIPNWVLDPNNPLSYIFSTYSAILCPWTADIDGDGTQDLFITDDTGHLYYFHNSGTPTHFQFQFVTDNWQNLFDPYIYTHRFGCFYDVDGDGDLDLFLSHEDYYWNPFNKGLRFYRNLGTPQSPNLVLENSSMFPDQMIWQAAPYITDIDQDGDGDLFVGDQWGGIRFFRTVTGESPVPNPKRPAPIERMITVLPNPGNSGTTISYVLSHPQHVNLSVYNLLGSRLATLVDGLQQSGEHVTSWDAMGRASGIYIVKLQTAEETFSKKLMVVK